MRYVLIIAAVLSGCFLSNDAPSLAINTKPGHTHFRIDTIDDSIVHETHYYVEADWTVTTIKDTTYVILP